MCIIHYQKGYTTKAARTTIRPWRGFDVRVFPDWASALHVAISCVHVMDEIWQATIRQTIVHPAVTIPAFFCAARCCGPDNKDALYQGFILWCKSEADLTLPLVCVSACCEAAKIAISLLCDCSMFMGCCYGCLPAVHLGWPETAAEEHSRFALCGRTRAMIHARLIATKNCGTYRKF